jgi:hypothetical protein
MLEFDQQNIFVKIPFERSISWFQNNKKTKKIHVSFKDEMWPQNKNAEWQLHNKMMDNSAPFLDQLFWPYLCFAEQLQSLVILMMFRWQNDWWHHLSQTRLDSWNSCICPTKMAQAPTMIFTSRLNYTTVVACNLSTTSITCYSDDVPVTKWLMTSSFTNSAWFLKLLHLSN